MTADLDQARLQAQLAGAYANLWNTHHNLEHGGWQNLAAHFPGYRANTLAPTGTGGDNNTQAERIDVLSEKALTVRNELQASVAIVAEQSVRLAEISRALNGRRPTPMTPPPDPRSWCHSCLRLGKCSPRHRNDLCRWCYDFNTEQGKVPPIELLGAHHRGERITIKPTTQRSKNRKRR